MKNKWKRKFTFEKIHNSDLFKRKEVEIKRRESPDTGDRLSRVGNREDRSSRWKYLVTQFGKLFRKQEIVSPAWEEWAEEMIDRWREPILENTRGGWPFGMNDGNDVISLIGKPYYRGIRTPRPPFLSPSFATTTKMPDS